MPLAPTCDASGNLTFDGTCHYACDAWNRLVDVHHAYYDGSMHLGSVISTVAYDGTSGGRRISKAITNSADLNSTYHYYYNGWSNVETRNGSDQLLKQQVWGTPTCSTISKCSIIVSVCTRRWVTTVPRPTNSNTPHRPPD